MNWKEFEKSLTLGNLDKIELSKDPNTHPELLWRRTQSS
jgi:hypothetical protein